MSKERNLKSIANTGLRLGAAALAVQMTLGTDRVARADINEPVRYPLADGRLLADAPLRTAGRIVEFTGPNGLDFCGVTTSEATVLTVTANEDLMNIKVAGRPDVFVDPIEGGGTDYPSRAASAVELLQSKATELINRTNRLWRRVAVILTRDAVNQNVCDLITDSGPFEVVPPVSFVPTAVPERPQAPVATVAPRGPEGAGNCFPSARTVFAPEGDANVDGTNYHADLRDLPSCIRFLGTWELGIDDPRTSQIEGAHNFKVRIPRGWSMVVSPTSVAVHREGGRQVDFVDGQVVIVDGPFDGGIGMYEGFAGLTLTDWVPTLADQRLVIQRQQAIGRSNVNVVKFVG